MNYVALVGRLAQEPEVKELQDGTFRAVVTIAVSKDYRNSEGVYDADFIKCVLWNGVASAAKDYCHKGDVIAIKGKIQTRIIEKENEKPKRIIEIIGEKVTFLNAKKTEE